MIVELHDWALGETGLKRCREILTPRPGSNFTIAGNGSKRGNAPDNSDWKKMPNSAAQFTISRPAMLRFTTPRRSRCISVTRSISSPWPRGAVSPVARRSHPLETRHRPLRLHRRTNPVGLCRRIFRFRLYPWFDRWAKKQLTSRRPHDFQLRVQQRKFQVGSRTWRQDFSGCRQFTS